MKEFGWKNYQYSIYKPKRQTMTILARMWTKWKGQKWECWGGRSVINLSSGSAFNPTPTPPPCTLTNTLLKSQLKSHRFSATISILWHVLILEIWSGTQTFRDGPGWYSSSISIAQDISSSWYAEFTFSSIIPFERESQVGQVLETPTRHILRFATL